MPSDHYLPDVTKFTACIHDAVEVARHGYIVTLGIQPRHAATEYGYIEVDAASSPSLPCGALVAARFTEKPNRSFAEQFTASGKHLWNAGIFVASARLIWDTVQRLAPDLAKSVEDAADSASSPKRVLLNKERYETARKISFDYAVMERSDRVAVLPYSGEWSDLGTWDAVAEYQSSSTNAHRKDQNKNIASVQSDNNFVLSQKLVATLGVSDLVVVDTDDVLMVAKRGQAELMRQLTAAVHLTNPRLLSDGSIGERPWGYYRQLARGDGYQVKLIEVEAGQRLSLQSHRHRSEHWIVVNGIATVQVGDATLTLRQGQHVFIPQGTRHRLANQQTVVLRLLEVQVGTYLEEDDIVRYQDDYGRVSGEGET
jgi:mannose-1-phosphate guanylyltransferase/mannose-6-phosphate isomerase